MDQYEADQEYIKRFKVMPNWTLRFSPQGPDHLYMPKRVNSKGEPASMQAPYDYYETLYYPVCVAGPVRLPLYFRSRRERTSYLKLTHHTGNEIQESTDYPHELTLCEECKKFELMTELAE